MRHGKKFNHLSRPTAHRKALLTNLAKSLILHKRLNTTVAKAKALKKFVEPILTKAKQDTTHSRRVVFAYFQDKVPVKELFNEIAPKITDRPGGYTRIIRLGNRLGDHAEICMIELVDYNEFLQRETKLEKAKTRRSRRKTKPTAKQSTETTQVATDKKPTTPKSATKTTQAAPIKLQDSGIQEEENLQAKTSQAPTQAKNTSTPDFSDEENVNTNKDK